MFVENDARRCRADFPALARRHEGNRLPLAFLDGPAGTQVPGAVIEAISGYYRTCNANTHGQFDTSRESDASIAPPARPSPPSWARRGRTISFGQNMTTLCYSLSYALGRELSAGDEVVITQLDHEANRGPWISLRERGLNVKEVRLRPDGRLDYDDMAAKIGPRTHVVAMGLSSNALGTVNDAAVARALSRAVGAILVLDAVHYAPHFPVDVTALDADYLLCSAYKFYGPHVGILYARPGLLEKLEPDRLRTQEQTPARALRDGHAQPRRPRGSEGRHRVHRGLGRWRGPCASGSCPRCRPSPSTSTPWRAATTRGPPDPGRAPLGRRLRRGPAGAHGLDHDRRRDCRGGRPPSGRSGVLVWDGNFYALRPIEVLGLVDRGGVLRAGFSMYNTAEEVDRLLTGVAQVARRSA